MSTPISREEVRQEALPFICAAWNARAKTLGLPKAGAKRERDREAYMQGALEALVAVGMLEVDLSNRIGFLCSVGRLGAWMDERAAAYDSIEPARCLQAHTPA